MVPEGEGGSGEIDNAIPLCFECHSEVGRYNPAEPRGNKYKIDELKARREQVYEEFTRQLVPPIHVEITQEIFGGGSRQLPNVGCNISHLGDALPVRVQVRVEVDRETGTLSLADHHLSGSRLIHLNPRFTIFDHFMLPEGTNVDGGELALKVTVVVHDQVIRSHELLPVHYVHVPASNSWYLRPY